MSENLKQTVKTICQEFGNDSGRMMDIVSAAQKKLGCVSPEAIDEIAAAIKAPRVDVESLVSFYAFYSEQPKGNVVIRLCNDIIDQLSGCEHVALALEDELGIKFGQTTPDGKISLEFAPCIGMCDQAPAALVNDVVVTNLSTDAARQMVRDLKQHMDPAKLVHKCGDGNNANPLVNAMVVNNIRRKDEVILADLAAGTALKKAISMTPAEVIREIKTARLRGRGGAGFPTGMKWEFTRGADGPKKYVICNADEGEPGTFKDRVILTECPDLLFEGMTIGGYAIGSTEGILYLRGEYMYLRPYLESVLKERRDKGLLGENICGKSGFNFDIRIQMGAGAYVCGEETSLISSCEGLRGDPKNRPPFPAQKGYKQSPTTVNNVETFCCVARILDKGSGWFSQIGSQGSPGTKLLSISGDCRIPGVYEVPFGIKLSEVLKMAGADNAAAVQMGGPSGQMVGPNDFERTICYDDLATGGSVMVFGPQRDLLKVVDYFMEFFIEESCGYCTPCRAGNVLLKERLDKIIDFKGEPGDLEYLENLGATIKATSRCGLGQTSPNPILSTLKNFREMYSKRLQSGTDGQLQSFDIHAALNQAKEVTGRESVLYNK